MTSRELVKAAIHFKTPERIPYNFDSNRTPQDGKYYGEDMMWVFVESKPPIDGKNEWGVIYKSVDESFGEPKYFPLKECGNSDDLKAYKFPKFNQDWRYKRMEDQIRNNVKEKYVLGMLPCGLFQHLIDLFGFEDFLVNTAVNQEIIEKAVDQLLEINLEVIDKMAALGVDGIITIDDTALQDRLMISIEKFREIFIPRFKKMYQHTHDYGMDTFIHSCGYTLDLIEEFIQAGCDVINLDQQDNMGIEEISRRYKGRICFFCPLDIQRTLSLNREELFQKAEQMIRLFSTQNGGFIAKAYPQPRSIGITDKYLKDTADAFKYLGVNRKNAIYSALEFKNPIQIPNDIWTLPWAEDRFPDLVKQLKQKYALITNVMECGYTEKTIASGNPFTYGEYMDEWGCIFENIQPGVIGEVKRPLIDLTDDEWEDTSKIHIPEELLSFDIETVNRWCKENEDRFIRADCVVRPFEQLQFIRGTELLYMDLMFMPEKMLSFVTKMHDFYCRLLEKWCQTDIDAVMLMDDWGSQESLLINPQIWRKVFKPMYKDYVQIAKRYGKKVLMHSDGNILLILEDLIEIGIDLLNCQIFCMGLENLRKYAGRICFWGEIDRQHILVNGTAEEVRKAVEQVYLCLWKNGGWIMQLEFGPGANPENVLEAYAAYDSLNKKIMEGSGRHNIIS